MMALQLLPLLQLIIIFYLPGGSTYPNPIYGTKRYGRSSQQRPLPYDPYGAAAVAPRYPLNYYKLYPYAQTYPEEYYYPPQESSSYPVYYAPPRASKLDYYPAAAAPYYYQDAYYDVGTPDWKEELLQEAEREEREDSQPIGHESFFENDDEAVVDPGLADANAAFLQNLILSQMYQDSLEGRDEYQEDPFEADEERNVRYPEDEDVRELKQLRKADRQQYRKQGKGGKGGEPATHWAQQRDKQRQVVAGPKRQLAAQDERKRSALDVVGQPQGDGASIFSERKPVVKESSSTTTTTTTTTTAEPRRDSRGQKEEFQMRPATPVRHPFAGPVLAMMTDGEGERKRAPSVYDTIRHMLDMEKSLENASPQEELRPAMKKRIITSEENLTRQLTVLKKAAK